VSKRARILVTAASEASARRLGDTLDFLERVVDRWHPGRPLPESFAPYKLLVCEVGADHELPDKLLARLRADAHVVLLLPSLDVRWVAYYMRDGRVNHFLASTAEPEELRTVVEKLDTGAIFGLDWYLPETDDVRYRQIRSYKQRRDALDEIEEYTRELRLRGRIRRCAGQVAEELLMNAMYQAPVDDEGARVFEEEEPQRRIRRRTPRPVSLRFVARDGALFISVRDRYGSFHRDSLAHYLLRCSTEEVQMEDKKLGAGLGLYIVCSTSSRIVVNVFPGKLSEFICVLEPGRADPLLRVLSVTTQRPPE